MIFPFHVRVFLATGPTDMRKSINGLSILLAQDLERDPLSGHLFVFCNKRQNMVKILYWDRNGFCLWHKRLEKQSFRWPKSASDACEVDHRQLGWLLEGLEINLKKIRSSFTCLMSPMSRNRFTGRKKYLTVWVWTSPGQPCNDVPIVPRFFCWVLGMKILGIKKRT